MIFVRIMIATMSIFQMRLKLRVYMLAVVRCARITDMCMDMGIRGMMIGVMMVCASEMKLVFEVLRM